MHIAIVFVLLATLLSSGAEPHGAALASQESAQRQRYPQVKLGYYLCKAPTPPAPCKAEEQSDETCPGCTEWDFVEDTVLVVEGPEGETLFLDSSNVRVEHNYFVADVSEWLWEFDSTAWNRDSPPTTSQLYEDPERYGWREIEPAEAERGAIVVWPGAAAIVVDPDEDRPGSSDPADIAIVYPSENRGGLRLLYADVFRSRGAPRFLVPRGRRR